MKELRGTWEMQGKYRSVQTNQDSNKDSHSRALIVRTPTRRTPWHLQKNRNNQTRTVLMKCTDSRVMTMLEGPACVL